MMEVSSWTSPEGEIVQMLEWDGRNMEDIIRFTENDAHFQYEPSHLCGSIIEQTIIYRNNKGNIVRMVPGDCVIKHSDDSISHMNRRNFYRTYTPL